MFFLISAVRLIYVLPNFSRFFRQMMQNELIYELFSVRYHYRKIQFKLLLFWVENCNKKRNCKKTNKQSLSVSDKFVSAP
jgi:hypothetical protein